MIYRILSDAEAHDSIEHVMQSACNFLFVIMFTNVQTTSEVRVTPWSRFVLEKLQFLGRSRGFAHIIEPECPFPLSQTTPVHNNAFNFHKIRLNKIIISGHD